MEAIWSVWVQISKPVCAAALIVGLWLAHRHGNKVRDKARKEHENRLADKFARSLTAD